MPHPKKEQRTGALPFKKTAGFHTTPQRSHMMAKIKSRDTRAELLLRRALWLRNIRYRLHDRSLPGRPDIVIRKYQLAIFVDGEFWHGHDWSNTKHNIHSNREFWIPKIERNIQKDQQTTRTLRDMGYVVFRFWSQDILKNLPQVINQIELFLETRRLYR